MKKMFTFLHTPFSTLTSNTNTKLNIIKGLSMKMLSLALLAVSFSAFASNPELDAIFKKYESSLMNFKVGMKSVSDVESTDFDIAEDGTMTSKLTKKYVTSVLLKVDGTKVYEYELTKDLSSGEESIVVMLIDHKYDSSSQSDISNIKVVNHVLSGNFTGNFDDEYSSYSYKGAFTKDLLTSLFCGSTNNVAGNYTDLSTGRVYPFKDNQINKCNGIMPTSDIKKIDLTEVEFCDNTLPDDSEYMCETRDMSFLTTDL